MSALTSVAVILTALGLATSPAPAAPPASGSLHSTADVLYDGCHHHPYRYTVDAPTDSWYLAVTVKGPDGKVVTTDHPYEGTSGSSSVQLCDYDRPGRYMITARGEWYDVPDDGTVHRFPVRSTSFSVRRPRTRTTIDTSHGRITVAVRGEQPASYRPLGGAKVTLQRRARGGWHDVASRYAGRQGRARFAPEPGRYRARVSARDYSPSTSGTVEN